MEFFYHKGENVAPDINKAIHYLKLAADQDNDYAQLFLGMIYFDGMYIKKDLDKAIHYLKLSAKHNNSLAANMLGSIYKDLPIIQNNNISTIIKKILIKINFYIALKMMEHHTNLI